MHWVFFDSIGWDYDVATPLVRPLGGSQSALCYLAAALARRGQDVTTVTTTSQPRMVEGVHCLNQNSVPIELLSRPGAVIVALNEPGSLAQQLRQTLGPRIPLILWTQHAHDQPAAQPLRDVAVQDLWNRIVCISDWQRQWYSQWLGVLPARIDVLRNAISPAFGKLPADHAALLAAKSPLVRLAYTSTPFRGLDVLIHCFPEIHRRHPHCRLEIYSSMQVYQQAAVDDPYRSLYAQCQTTPGVHYRGSLSQQLLAGELAGVSILAYPNTFAETSCIAVMEALAAGLLVVTSDLGALSETCQGYARLIPPIGPGRSAADFAGDFIEATCAAIRELEGDAASLAQRQFQQAKSIAATCNWDSRAAEWEAVARNWLA